jgi:hypothetical protein
VGGQRHTPAALPPGKTRYPLYRRLGESLGRSGQVRKISPPPGFDPRTFQPVASRYTDWAIPVHTEHKGCIINNMVQRYSWKERLYDTLPTKETTAYVEPPCQSFHQTAPSGTMPSHTDSVHTLYCNSHFNKHCTLSSGFHMWPSCLADFRNKELYRFLVCPPTRVLHCYWRQTVKQNHMAALTGMILLFIRGFTNIDLHTVIEQGTTNTTQAPLQLGGHNFKL